MTNFKISENKYNNIESILMFLIFVPILVKKTLEFPWYDLYILDGDSLFFIILPMILILFIAVKEAIYEKSRMVPYILIITSFIIISFCLSFSMIYILGADVSSNMDTQMNYDNFESIAPGIISISQIALYLWYASAIWMFRYLFRIMKPAFIKMKR